MEEENNELKIKMLNLLQKAEEYTDKLLHHHKQSQFQQQKSSIKRGHYSQQNIDNLSPDEDEQQHILYKQPQCLKNGTLKPYQLISLNWMIALYENHLHGILADDMGLGKTIQSIAFFAYLYQFKNSKGPHIMIGPKSVLGNWQNELNKWLPNHNVIKLIATKEERQPIIDNIIKPQKFDVCLVSYEGAKICSKYLKKIQWKSCIIDEAHKIKNEDSQISIIVREFKTEFKLLLTGTPLQNNLHELWSLLNYLLPSVFENSDIFDEWFSAGNIQQQNNTEMISQLHKILKPFMLRRTKLEVEKQLPPKKQIHLLIGITEIQAKLYKSLLTNKTLDYTSDDKSSYMNILMQLRKVCNHPYLFPGVEDQTLPQLGDHLIYTCGKMQVLDKLLNKLYSEKENNHQILIFSQMTMVLDILEDYCNYRQYNYCRLDGNTDMISREEQISEFIQQDSKKFIFLLSTRAGGLGINLASADTVILYDSDWNPQMDLQAMDRAHRIGQKKQVMVYRLISDNTVEQKIIERQSIKLKWDNLIIQQGGMQQNKQKTALNKDEVKQMIQYGASAIIKAEKGTYNDEEIDKILERGETMTQDYQNQLNKKFDQQTKELGDLTLNSINIYDFLGNQTTNKEDEEIIDQLTIQEQFELKQRQRKNMNYNINKAFNEQMAISTATVKNQKTIKLSEHILFKDREILQDLLQKESDYIYNKKKDDEDPYNGLTEQEFKLKEELDQTGFKDWLKQDYYNFIKGCTQYGRNNYKEISDVIKSKTEQEVKEYSQSFWQQINTFVENDKIIKNIQIGEKYIENRIQTQALIDEKCKSYIEPKYELQFNQLLYNRSKSKFYTYENDKWLIYIQSSNNIGYGNWEKLRKAVKTENLFRFDPFIKARSEIELKTRVLSLVKVMEKELEKGASIEDIEQQFQSSKQKKKKKSNKKLEKKLQTIMEEQSKKSDKKEDSIERQNIEEQSIIDKKTPQENKSQKQIENQDKPEEAEQINQKEEQKIEYKQQQDSKKQKQSSLFNYFKKEQNEKIEKVQKTE